MLLRTEHLDNGLVVEFFDRSNRYFGDYHRICVEVRCRVSITEDFFAEAADPAGELESARALLGNAATFSRVLEKMGVAGAEVEAARQGLIENFIRGTLSYMGGSDFPRRFVVAEVENRRRGRRPQWPR